MLKQALSGLPKPSDDYEIVLPEGEASVHDVLEDEDFVQDRSDIDARKSSEIKAKCKY